MKKQAPPATRACGYVRMSSAEQESSPAQQQKEIASLAKQKGYEIVAWYADEGISGDEVEKRPDFCRMLADAQKGKFQVILCWDQDRFGRFDSLKAGFVVEPLRGAGVRLVTVTQGEIDWNDFAGRMMYAIQQEGKNQFLLNLSANALRGRMQSAREGHGVSCPPLGYDRVFLDTAGKQVHRVGRNEQFEKPQGWKAKLDVSANKDEVEIVRYLFQRYATTDANLRSLAHELNRRGFRTRKDKLWDGPSVKVVLQNPAYLGRLVMGRFPRGRFNHVGNGGIGGTGPIVVENAHPALIDEATFRKVQAKLKRRAIKDRSRSNDYLLSGLLICGHSGTRMHGAVARKQSGLRCYAGYQHEEGGTCGPQLSFKIQKEPLERFVVGKVVELLNAPAVAERLREAITRKLKGRPGAAESAKSLQVRIDALDRKITKGAERLLLIDPEDMADASAALANWRAERRELAAQMERLDQRGDESPEEQADRVVAELEQLRESFASADPETLRAALRSVIESITLFWALGPRRKWRRFQRGVIRFAPNSLVALERWTTTSPRSATPS